MNIEKLNDILSAHLKYLRGEEGGVCANLSSADLSGAHLYGASLYGASLYGANLDEKTIMPAVAVVPDEGEFTAYKKVCNGIVLTLIVPEYAARLTVYGDRQSRVSHAIPICAQRDGKPVTETKFFSLHDHAFIYRLGEVAEVKDFCADPRVVCAAGIHCYITKKEAEAHS